MHRHIVPPQKVPMFILPFGIVPKHPTISEREYNRPARLSRTAEKNGMVTTASARGTHDSELEREKKPGQTPQQRRNVEAPSPSRCDYDANNTAGEVNNALSISAMVHSLLVGQ